MNISPILLMRWRRTLRRRARRQVRRAYRARTRPYRLRVQRDDRVVWPA
jgi:hypothetical protein